MPDMEPISEDLNELVEGLEVVPNLVLEGGIVQTGAWVQEGEELFQPEAALWLESESGVLRAFTLIPPISIDPAAPQAALTSLVDAIIEPPEIPGLPPAGLGLPSRVAVNNRDLAADAKSLLEPHGVTVEYVEHLPAVESVAEEMAKVLGGQQEPPEPFDWDVDPALLPPLFEAATAFLKQEPWRYLPDNPPLAVALGEHAPEPGAETLYASIMGGAGELFGVAFYYTLEDFAEALEIGEELMASDEEIDAAVELLKQMGAPLEDVPPDAVREMVGSMLAAQSAIDLPDPAEMGDCLSCVFDEKDDLDPTYLEWLKGHKLGRFLRRKMVPSFMRTVEGEEDVRAPNAGEVRALTLALQAVVQFVAQTPTLLEEAGEETRSLSYRAQARLGNQTVEVKVTYPPAELFVEDGEDLDGAEDEDLPELPE